MPTVYEPAYFDPLSTESLTSIICEMFERQPLVSMAFPVPRFFGSGLYAIYYRGSTIDLYVPLAAYQIPVYAGQSASGNSATGNNARARSPLAGRLSMHRTSIADGGLPLGEFRFRALRMPDVHADLGEDGLRRVYKPVWNNVLTGFGSNEQGQSTRSSAKSKWDSVHAGRSRTFGEASRDPEVLREAARQRIATQISGYDDLPWPHPASETLIDSVE